MSFGPDKYDDVCEVTRITTGALGVILVVIDGKRGSGFSCQAPLEITRELPHILRCMADQMEEDVKRDVRAAERIISHEGGG